MKPYLVTIECETADVTWLERSIVRSNTMPTEAEIIYDVASEYVGGDSDEAGVSDYIHGDKFVTEEMTQTVYRIEEITESEAEVLSKFEII